jgi:hypothetical protein
MVTETEKMGIANQHIQVPSEHLSLQQVQVHYEGQKLEKVVKLSLTNPGFVGKGRNFIILLLEND